MTSKAPDTVNRIERILAFMIIGIVLLSLACFIAVIVGTANGLEREDFTAGLWPVVSAAPMFGLPVAFFMVMVLMFLGGRRRARENRAAVGGRP